MSVLEWRYSPSFSTRIRGLATFGTRGSNRGHQDDGSFLHVGAIAAAGLHDSFGLRAGGVVGAGRIFSREWHGNQFVGFIGAEVTGLCYPVVLSS